VIQNRNGGGPWFRMVRRGDLFTGFRSADGVAWIQQMDAVVVPMGQSVRVGLIVNAQNNGSTISIADAAKRMTVVFDRLSGLPDVDGAPDVGVGADRTVAVGVPFMVTGTARDDGGTPQVSWSRISGPGSAIIARPATASTRVTLDQAGVHVLRFTGDDGTARTFAELTVTAGNPPAITTTALPVVRIGDAVAIALAADHAPTGWSASGLPPGLAIAAADGLISGSPSAVGSFAVTATAANALGRDVRTWVLTVEDLPDLPPVITSVAPTAVRTGATVAITGSGFAGGATVRIGGTTAVADWISVSRLIATIPAGLAGQVRVVVANGTATAAWSGRIEVDDVPPPRPATAAIAGNGTPAPVLSGTAAAAVAVAIRIDGSERLRLALAGGGAWSWTPALTVGTHVVEVQAFDAAGNASPLSPPVTVTVAAPPGPVDPGSGGGGGGGCGLGSGLGLILIGLFLARRRR
jgi:hypothetical protein